MNLYFFPSTSSTSNMTFLLAIAEKLSPHFNFVHIQYHKPDFDFVGISYSNDLVIIEFSGHDDLTFINKMQEKISNLIILGSQQNFSLLKNQSLSQYYADASNLLAIKSTIQKYIDKNKTKSISKINRHQENLFIDNTCNSLTLHQVELLKTISKGYLYKEIAEKFSISEGTVKQHLHKIYNKLNVANKVEAINKLAMM